MATESTTNIAKDTYMIDENEMDNTVSQKHSTMAQVTMSQKKAKGKLFSETKCPPF